MNNISQIKSTPYVKSLDGDMVPADSPRGIEAKELNRLESQEKQKEREANQAKLKEEALLKKQAELAKLQAEIDRMDSLKPKPASSRRKVTSKDAE